jgi:hypothetical protein
MNRMLGALALVIACLVAMPSPAQAEARRCVSPGEYAQVHKGMPKRAVHRVFDTRGRRVAFSRHGRFTSEIRRYPGCPHRSAVSVAYGNGRLRAKSASW